MCVILNVGLKPVLSAATRSSAVVQALACDVLCTLIPSPAVATAVVSVGGAQCVAEALLAHPTSPQVALPVCRALAMLVNEDTHVLLPLFIAPVVLSSVVYPMLACTRAREQFCSVFRMSLAPRAVWLLVCPGWCRCVRVVCG